MTLLNTISNTKNVKMARLGSLKWSIMLTVGALPAKFQPHIQQLSPMKTRVQSWQVLMGYSTVFPVSWASSLSLKHAQMCT